MQLNSSKCSHTRVTRSPSPLITSYHVNGNPIDHQQSFKLLGVIISADLKWNLQTEQVRCKAMRALGMVSRGFSGRGRGALRLLYLSFIRSILMYGTPAWHPTTLANLAKLESVQAKATRMIIGQKKSIRGTRDLRLVTCRLPNVPDLLNKIDLKFLTKCLQGACDFSLFSPSRVSVRSRREGLRGGDGFLSHPRGNNSAYLASLIPRCVRTFNLLPEKERRKLLVV